MSRGERLRPLDVGPDSSDAELMSAVRGWATSFVPEAWRRAAEAGGPAAVRRVRSHRHYAEWYPVYGYSGLAAPAWPRAYGGLDLRPSQIRLVESELGPLNLGRLNPLGLNLAAPALFVHGTEAQRLRYLPPIVRNEEVWCQLFSEPGAGSDLASLATRAVRDGSEWLVTGQKVWSTWAHVADFGVLLARTDVGVPKRRGLTYFLLDLRQPGVDVRPLRHMGGETEFNEVWLQQARIPDSQRVGDVGQGWTVAGATLSGERQMVAGAGSGGVDRIGGSSADSLLRAMRADRVRPDRLGDPVVRQRVVSVYVEERVRRWTNDRVRGRLTAGRPPGPESSVGKIHQGGLNQRLQMLAADSLGLSATAWSGDEQTAAAEGYSAGMPYEVRAMLRSRANTIEGGTTEVNKNIVAERVLGLPRDPDPWRDTPWREVPRSG